MVCHVITVSSLDIDILGSFTSLLVLNYEVVLSNGTIVNANPSSNGDLYWALKGGGNQFGKHTCSSPDAGFLY